MKEAVESVLPLVTVSYDAKLQPGAVKEDEFDRSDRVPLLDLIANFDVLRDGRVEVNHLWTLIAPSLEEKILLSFPNHHKPFE